MWLGLELEDTQGGDICEAPKSQQLAAQSPGASRGSPYSIYSCNCLVHFLTSRMSPGTKWALQLIV